MQISTLESLRMETSLSQTKQTEKTLYSTDSLSNMDNGTKIMSAPGSKIIYTTTCELVLLSNSYQDIMVKISIYAWPCVNNMMCTIFVELSCEFLLLKFRQFEHRSEQSKPNFKPSTLVKLRCLLKLQYFDFFVYIFIMYFDFVCLHIKQIFH